MTQVKDDKYFNALFRFDSLNRQMFFRLLKAVETFSCLHQSNSISSVWPCCVFHGFFDKSSDCRLVFVQIHPFRTTCRLVLYFSRPITFSIDLNTWTVRIDPIAGCRVHFDDNISFGNLTDLRCSQCIFATQEYLLPTRWGG